MSRSFTFFHFNDISYLDSGEVEPVGGLCRFTTLVKQLRTEHPDLLLLFGGDALSPSLNSSVTRGAHIPPFFNALGVDYAVTGNHDFDFGVDRLREIRKECRFPWLLANIVAVHQGVEEPLAGAQEYVITTINGIKVGIMGLAEKEWLDCLTRMPESTRYIDQAEVGRSLCKKLRSEGCEVVIALTHSREPQDTYLAQNCPDLDLIIGGSEFRSGTLTHVTLHDGQVEVTGEDIGDGPEWTLHGKRISCHLKQYLVTSDVPCDIEMGRLVEESNKSVKQLMLKTLGYTSTVWDVSELNCRTRECNVGSWMADLMRENYQADIGVLCGGTLRSGDRYGPGDIKMGDIMKILPFPDTVTVCMIRGKYLLEGLENGLSAYPTPEGRFPQISGAVIEFDPSKEPGHRIMKCTIGGEDVDPERMYRMATRAYLMKGGDGYKAFGHYEELLIDDEGLPLSTMVVNHFLELKVLHAMQRSERVKNLVATAFTPNPVIPEMFQVCPKTDGRIRVVSSNQ